METRVNDYTYNINNAGHVTFDTGEWDRTTIQAIGSISGVFGIYGSIDDGGVQGQFYGNAALATNFTPIQATNLATGTKVTTISAAGLYEVDNNAKFIQLTGGASIYKILIANRKIY